jgi:hypothetical protein
MGIGLNMGSESEYFFCFILFIVCILYELQYYMDPMLLLREKGSRMCECQKPKMFRIA